MRTIVNLHPTPHLDTDDAADAAGPEQLTLLTGPERAPARARFRLGRATCERGLRHVAEIKQQLAERQRERELASVHRLPPRHRDAA